MRTKLNCLVLKISVLNFTQGCVKDKYIMMTVRENFLRISQRRIKIPNPFEYYQEVDGDGIEIALPDNFVAEKITYDVSSTGKTYVIIVHLKEG